MGRGCGSGPAPTMGHEQEGATMQINTLSAYQTAAEEFFDKIAEWKADLVLDVRLKNTNQLSGFSNTSAAS